MAAPVAPLDIFALTEANFLRVFGIYLLSVVRVSGLIINLPAFGESVIPTRAKAALAAVMTFLLLPYLARTQQLPDLTVFGYGLVVIRELVIGLTLGLLVLMVIDTLKFAGELIGMQIGFSFVQVVDPESNREMAIIAEILQVVGVLFFLVLGGHLIVMQAVAESFHIVPLNGLQVPGSVVAQITTSVSSLIAIGLRIAMPVIGVILIGDVALGIIARTVPRMNVFEVGFPIKIFLGVILIVLMSSRFAPLIRELVQRAYGQFNTILNLMGQ